MRPLSSLFILSLLGAYLSGHAQATTGKASWDTVSERVKASEAVPTLGPDLMGDEVSHSNGALSFSMRDVSIPGNSALPMSVTRKYQVRDMHFRKTDGMFKDWELDLPEVSATFVTEWVSQHFSNGAISNARCSEPGRPPLMAHHDGLTWHDFWHGITINIPGVTGGELLNRRASNTNHPSGAVWMTKDQVHVSCLGSIQNGSGQGFLAITPDGTKYWFNWMARNHEPELTRGTYFMAYGGDPDIYWSQNLPVYRYRLLATRVEDRFGNAIEYTYSNDWDKPARLTRIRDVAGGEGRQIDIEYSNDAISKITDGTRQWTYTYGVAASDRRTLTTVNQGTQAQPNLRTWNINFSQFTNADIVYAPVSGDSGVRSCMFLQMPTNWALTPVGTITHPSGAVGTFTVSIVEHSRSNVPVACENVTTRVGFPLGTFNNENDDSNRFPISYQAFSLKTKTISGNAMPTATWNYSYASDQTVVQVDPSTSWSYPVCRDRPGVNCMVPPPCSVSGACGSARTTILGPDSTWTRYTYGNVFMHDEGKLKKVETGSSETNILRTVHYQYDLDPNHFLWGDGVAANGDSFQDERLRPLLRTDTFQQDATFTYQASLDPVWARPTQVTRSSSLGHSKTESTSYHDNSSLWVVGQIATVTNTTMSPHMVTSRTAYSGSALPETIYWPNAVGTSPVPQHTLAYNADGTLATVTDQFNNITTLSSWYRGVPRRIQYPDTYEQNALVNALGWITEVKDQYNSATNYAYDGVGQLASITYPTADVTAWNQTTLKFEKLGTAELGFPVGTWRQEVKTGDGIKRTYFDALWRPILSHEYDAANVFSTSRYTASAYDETGRQVFSAFPVASATSIASLGEGEWTTYDALGRMTSVANDSEWGPLVTFNQYLTGFQTKITNPRSLSKTISFQAFDSPDTSAPIQIVEPGGRTTTIQRDALGRSTSVQRTDSVWAQTATRNYLYDAFGRLCTLTESETGTTVMDYDLVGNLSWSIAGMPLAGVGCSDARAAASALPDKRIVRVYDSMRRLTHLMFVGNNGNQHWTYERDGLPKSVTTWNEGGTNAVVNAYVYNKRRMLIGESVQQLGWYTWGIGYGYNANGHLASQSYPTGLTVNYAPNGLGQATQASTYATGVQYYPDGAIKQFTYGNGITHAMTQNSRQIPVHVVDSGVLNLNYNYDQNGNVLSIVDNLAGSRSRYLNYDDLDRLTDAGSAMFGGDHWHRFTYDRLDNLRSWKLTYAKDFANYEYDASNRLTRIRDSGGTLLHNFSYDDQGNMTARGDKIYAFDQGNRLRSVSNSSGQLEAYRYDGYGRRVHSTETDGKMTLWQYASNGQMLFSSKLFPGGQTTHENVYLSGSLVATIDHNWPSNAVIATKYHHTDALGSPVAVTNELGTVIDRTNYEPFGKAIGKNVDGIGYAGHVEDDATKLTYMQQRYYDPEIGRFISADPMSSSQETGWNLNRYNYAANSPYRFVDKDGRQASEVDDFNNAKSNCGDDCVLTPMGNEGKRAFVSRAVVLDAISAQAAAGSDITDMNLADYNTVTKKDVAAAAGVIEKGAAGLSVAAFAAGQPEIGGPAATVAATASGIKTLADPSPENMGDAALGTVAFAAAKLAITPTVVVIETYVVLKDIHDVARDLVHELQKPEEE